LFLMKRANVKFNLKEAATTIAPYAAVMLVYGLMRIAVVGTSHPPTFEEHATVLDWLTLVPWMFGKYVQYAVVPYPLVGLHLTPLYLKDRMLSSVVYLLMIAAGLLLLIWAC